MPVNEPVDTSQMVPKAVFDALEARVADLESRHAGCMDAAGGKALSSNVVGASASAFLDVQQWAMSLQVNVDGLASQLSRLEAQMKASLQVNIDVLASRLATLEAQLNSKANRDELLRLLREDAMASNQKENEADRLTRIHESLMEMYENAMHQKADITAVEEAIASALVKTSKSRPGSAGTMALTDRLSVTATPFVSRLAGTQSLYKERRAAGPSQEQSRRGAESYMASLAAQRSSAPRRAHLASSPTVDHPRHPPVLHRRPGSATLPQGATSVSAPNLHRCGGPTTLQSTMHPPPPANVALDASLAGSKRRTSFCSKSAESLHWEDLAVALAPSQYRDTYGMTSFNQSLSVLDAGLLAGAQKRVTLGAPPEV